MVDGAGGAGGAGLDVMMGKMDDAVLSGFVDVCRPDCGDYLDGDLDWGSREGAGN